MKKPKICIVTSRGGHLYQMYRLKPWWKKHDRFWVTISGADTKHLLRGEKVYYAHHPESRNLLNAFRNIVVAMRILSHERPSLLISCGAGIAPPFYLIGRCMGIKLVWIEPYDFVKYLSLSGRLVAPFVDEYLVQHEHQEGFAGKAKYRGGVL